LVEHRRTFDGRLRSAASGGVQAALGIEQG
jgi:hypothetical protein